MDMIREDRQDQVVPHGQGEIPRRDPRHQGLLRARQPVLVGTTSIENSELLSGLLARQARPQVLNAKQHAREAEIVAQAGRAEDDHHPHQHGGPRHRHLLAATSKAVRADRRHRENLPPEEKSCHRQLRSEWQALHNQVVKAAACTIIGTERHESRASTTSCAALRAARAIPQLPLLHVARGSAAQDLRRRRASTGSGDAEDAEGEAIEHASGDRSIESAQRKSRRGTSTSASSCSSTTMSPTTSEREIYPAQRNEILDAKDVSGLVTRLRAVPSSWTFSASSCRGIRGGAVDIAGLRRAEGRAASRACRSRLAGAEPELDDGGCSSALPKRRSRPTRPRSGRRRRVISPVTKRYVTLQIIDAHWREHLAALDHLPPGYHCAATRREPQAGVQREGVQLFGAMVEAVEARGTKT